MPWAAHRPGQHAVGFVIINEPFGSRVPFYLAIQPSCDVSYHTEIGSFVAGLDRSYRVTAGSHTVKEISAVLPGLVEVYLVRLNFHFQQ